MFIILKLVLKQAAAPELAGAEFPLKIEFLIVKPSEVYGSYCVANAPPPFSHPVLFSKIQFSKIRFLE